MKLLRESRDAVIAAIREADAELEKIREELRERQSRNHELIATREQSIAEFRAYERILRELGYPGVDLYP